MNRYLERFQQKTLFPVIHALDYNHAMRNTELAFECGADGVFLINMGYSADKLMGFYPKVREQFPSSWIGLNLLGVSLLNLFNYEIDTASGLWVDDAKISVDPLDNKTGQAHAFLELKKTYSGLYFGGTVFKYTPSYSEDPIICSQAAEVAASFMDVVTTSGSGTGFKAPLEKMKAMKTAIGQAPLAVASGITPENVHSYLDYVDSFLVSTGISYKDTDELNPILTRKLADIIHQTA